MKTKFLFIGTAIIFLFSSCATIQGIWDSFFGVKQSSAGTAASSAPVSTVMNYSVNLKNPHNYPLYPGVGSAFLSLKEKNGPKAATINVLDCLYDEFKIQNCVAARSSSNFISYSINMSYTDNHLKIDYTDIEPVDMALLLVQTNAPEVRVFNTQAITDQLVAQIESSLMNADAYNTARLAFAANNELVQRSLNTVTGANLAEYTKTVFDGVISLSASILDVKVNENAQFKDYPTLISARLVGPTSASAFAFINFYTNDSSHSRLRSGQQILLTGKVIRIEKSIQTTFTMTN